MVIIGIPTTNLAKPFVLVQILRENFLLSSINSSLIKLDIVLVKHMRIQLFLVIPTQSTVDLVILCRVNEYILFKVLFPCDLNAVSIWLHLNKVFVVQMRLHFHKVSCHFPAKCARQGACTPVVIVK